jgi:hypothetical protein
MNNSYYALKFKGTKTYLNLHYGNGKIMNGFSVHFSTRKDRLDKISFDRTYKSGVTDKKEIRSMKSRLKREKKERKRKLKDGVELDPNVQEPTVFSTIMSAWNYVKLPYTSEVGAGNLKDVTKSETKKFSEKNLNINKRISDRTDSLVQQDSLLDIVD